MLKARLNTMYSTGSKGAPEPPDVPPIRAVVPANQLPVTGENSHLHTDSRIHQLDGDNYYEQGDKRAESGERTYECG